MSGRVAARSFARASPGHMKRPVLGTLSILALLGAGIYLAVQYKDEAQAPRAADACYEGAAARSKFMDQFDFALPAAADDVRLCVEYAERTQLSFARFDVPAAEMVALFPERSRFPEWADLRADAALVQSMSVLTGAQRPWWQLAPSKEAVAAQKSGQRTAAGTTLRWRAQVCAAPLSQGVMRVYVAASEEPSAAP
jgi:hypothetical protein